MFPFTVARTGITYNSCTRDGPRPGVGTEAAWYTVTTYLNTSIAYLPINLIKLLLGVLILDIIKASNFFSGAQRSLIVLNKLIIQEVWDGKSVTSKAVFWTINGPLKRKAMIVCLILIEAVDKFFLVIYVHI